MTRELRSAAAALALSLAVALPADAAMHCGHRIISRGDSAAKLLQFCGKPEVVARQRAERIFTTRHGLLLPGFVEEVWVEDWTYNFGPNKLMRLVRVEDGVVTNIRTLERRGY